MRDIRWPLLAMMYTLNLPNLTVYLEPYVRHRVTAPFLSCML